MRAQLFSFFFTTQQIFSFPFSIITYYNSINVELVKPLNQLLKIALRQFAADKMCTCVCVCPCVYVKRKIPFKKVHTIYRQIHEYTDDDETQQSAVYVSIYSAHTRTHFSVTVMLEVRRCQSQMEKST